MTAHGKKGFGGGTALPLRSCLFAVTGLRNQDPFLSSRGKKRFFRLAAMPPAGLLRDSPPEARLRIRRCAFICHRQRLAPDPRKATRGSVLWTPRKRGEPKGATRVAARAVRRGLEPRIPLTLNCTSDRGFTSPLPAARATKNSKTHVIAKQTRRAGSILTREKRATHKALSKAALRTVTQSGMDFVPDMHKV